MSAFRLHSLQFNVTRFHFTSTRSFVHTRSHICTCRSSFIQINPAVQYLTSAKFRYSKCEIFPKFRVEKHNFQSKICFGFWQFLSECVVTLTQTNLFVCVDDFDVSFSLAYQVGVICASLAFAIHDCFSFSLCLSLLFHLNLRATSIRKYTKVQWCWCE